MPEFSLAVAACMWPHSESRAARVSRCLDRRIDWTHFLRVVNRHHVVGLAFHALDHAERDRIPEEFFLELKMQAERLALQSLRAAIETSRLATAFQNAGIPCIILKGAPLAMLAYKSLSLRRSGDIDLLISRHDSMGADRVLLSAGYTRITPPQNSAEKLVDLYMRHYREFEYVNRSTGMTADLHYRLHDNSAFGRMIDLEHVRRNWRTVDLGGGLPVHTLGDEDMLLYLCAHGAGHVWLLLKWLADVGALLALSPDAASCLLERSRAQGTQRTAMQALLLCHSFWDLPLPSQMPAANWAVRSLVRQAHSTMTAGNALVEPYDRRFGTTGIVLSRDLLSGSPRYLLNQLLSHLFSATDMERFPPRILFLYPVIRFPLWVVRKLRFRKTLAH